MERYLAMSDILTGALNFFAELRADCAAPSYRSAEKWTHRGRKAPRNDVSLDIIV